MIKQQRQHTLKMSPGVYYVWVAGSCDYGHEERCSGGTYIMQKNNEVIDTFITSDDHTTEFRMILTAMIHAMETIPKGSNIIFITNVSYIHQNFDREPSDKSANPDLIRECIRLKQQHHAVDVKLVPFHKYNTLTETNDMAHKAMIELRNR